MLAAGGQRAYGPRWSAGGWAAGPLRSRALLGLLDAFVVLLCTTGDARAAGPWHGYVRVTATLQDKSNDNTKDHQPHASFTVAADGPDDTSTGWSQAAQWEATEAW